jgi:hypothetical protein
MGAPYLASDVMDSARLFLNDIGLALYTNTVLLPAVKMANEELESILLANGQVGTLKAISSVLQVASSTTPSSLAAPPSDLFVPIRLEERASGSSDDYTPMTEQEFEEQTGTNTQLGVWVFRNGVIRFPPCQANREVLVYYYRQMTPVTSASSNEEITGAKTYLAAKTAELAARYIGMNKEIADDLLQIEVIPARERLESIYVKNSQGKRTRRRRFGFKTAYITR